MEGWIMLHRKIRSHWIWEDPVKLRWWIDMILEANHTDGTVNIGMQLIECKRGQSVRSLQGWSKRWGVSKSTVRSFFDLLKNDSMLRTENITVTTRITILNYDDYQTLPHATQTQRKRKPNATQTQSDPNNNDNNILPKGSIISGAKTPVSLHTRCKNIFLSKYNELTGEEYYWDRKDAGNMNPIIKKITFNREKKKMPTDDDSIESAFAAFLESIKDRWILENFSIPNINSKFNEIISQAKQNGHRKQQQATTDDELLESIKAGIQRGITENSIQ